MMEHIIDTGELQSLARPMSEFIDVPRMVVCIDEAERLDVIPNIGDALFLELLNDTEGLYSLLLVGGVWDDACGRPHIMKGLKATVAYYAYARLIRLADNTLTRYGFVSKTDEYSERVGTKERVAAYTDAKIVADGYMQEVMEYLRAQEGRCGRLFGDRLKKYGRVRYNVIGE